MKSTLFACLATASLVSAHATWQDLWVNSEDKVETCVRLPVSNSPVQDVTSNDMRCNAGTSAVAKTCSVAGTFIAIYGPMCSTTVISTNAS